MTTTAEHRKQLEETLRADLAFLAEWENELRLARDPTERHRARREIERLKEVIAGRQAELQELQEGRADDAAAIADAVPHIRRAFVAWYSLLFAPSFLDNPQHIRPQLALLARSSKESSGAAISAGEDPRRYNKPLCAPREKTDPPRDRHIPHVGRVVSAQDAPWFTLLLASASGLDHTPFLVDCSWRFSGLSARCLDGRDRAIPRLRLHIYPYGVIVAILTVALDLAQGLDPNKFSLLLRDLSPTGKAHFACRTPLENEPRERSHEDLLALLVETLEKDLLQEQGKVLRKGSFGHPVRSHTGSVVSISHAEPPFDWHDGQGAMKAICTLRPDWDGQPGGAEEYNRSDWGEHPTDLYQSVEIGGVRKTLVMPALWVIAEGLQTVIYRPFTQARKRRHLFWRLFALNEFARIEVFLYEYFAARFRQESGNIYDVQAQPARSHEQVSYGQRFVSGFHYPPRKHNFLLHDLASFYTQLGSEDEDFYRILAGKLDLEEKRTTFEQSRDFLLEAIKDYKPLLERLAKDIPGLLRI